MGDRHHSPGLHGYIEHRHRASIDSLTRRFTSGAGYVLAIDDCGRYSGYERDYPL